ncbi:unnamed protein product, partial [Vitis vinifera]
MLSQTKFQLFKFTSLHFLSKPLHLSTSSHFTKKSCIFLLKNCKSMQHLKQIQTQILRTGFHQSGDTLNKFMVCCTDPSIGNLHYAERIFNYIDIPGLFIYNLVIKAFTKNGSFRKAVLLFRQLREEGLSPDNFTYPFVFKAIGCLGEVREGEKVYGFVVKSGLEFDTYVCNSLMDMYAEVGRVQNLRQVFEEMPQRDVVSWNVLISGYVKCRRYEDAVDVFRQIFNDMPIKTVICWTSMVSGYVNCGQLDEARELFERSPVRDVVLWTAMINGYVQFNRFDDAVALFREMQIKRVSPDRFTLVALLTDAVVGTALIEMYAKCGFIEKSLEIFNGLKEKDTASWTSIICGLAMNGKTSKALELFAEMVQTGVKPDDITFIGVLSACSHGGLVEEGRKHFRSMTAVYQIEPKLEHYGCLIDLLGRAGQLDEAEELIEKSPNVNNEVIVPLYGALLSACRTHGNVEMGERVAKRLVGIESGDSSVHTLLANIYASADRWEDVTKVRRKMKDLGVKKVPGCSSVEVNGIVHEFLVGDASHPEMREIYSMLDSIAKPLLGLDENEMEGEIPVPVLL